MDPSRGPFVGRKWHGKSNTLPKAWIQSVTVTIRLSTWLPLRGSTVVYPRSTVQTPYSVGCDKVAVRSHLNDNLKEHILCGVLRHSPTPKFGCCYTCSVVTVCISHRSYIYWSGLYRMNYRYLHIELIPSWALQTQNTSGLDCMFPFLRTRLSIDFGTASGSPSNSFA